VPARVHLWPGDDHTAQLILLDAAAVPMPEMFRRWAEQLAAQGITTMRTGALAPRHAAQAESAGLHCIQELALLEARPPLRPSAAEGSGRASGRRRGMSLVGARRGGGVRTTAWRDGRSGELDLADMAAVDHAAFGDLWRLDAAMLRDVCAATPSFRARVAREGRDGEPGARRGRPVGFLISGRAGRIGYVQRLAVHPDQHRRGIATALLEDSLGWMQRWGAERVLVNTHIENHAALALYRGHGFVDLPERLRVYEGSTRP